MSDRREIIAQGVEQCKMLTGRYLAGFDDSNCTHQPPNLPNHVAWCLGHCAHTMHRVGERFDGRGIPESDFIPGAVPPAASLPTGRRPDKFWIESVAFDSAPVDDPRLYPGLARATAVYDAACDRLGAAIRGAPDSTLDETTPWGSDRTQLGLLLMRIVFHNGHHVGEIVDTRRALKMARVLK